MIIPKAIKAPPNKKRKLLDPRYEIGTVIGKGVTCHVFAGVDIQDQSPVAIERINDPFFNRHYAKGFMKEIISDFYGAQPVISLGIEAFKKKHKIIIYYPERLKAIRERNALPQFHQNRMVLQSNF